MIKPGIFGTSYTADTRRSVFDFHNEQIMTEKKVVDCVFIGDSITEYCDWNVFFDKLGYIVNRGVGGDISEIVKKRYMADVMQLKPQKAVCLIGCNDLMTMHYDNWWKKEGRDVGEIVRKLTENIEEIIKMSDGVKLYICSVLPTDLCIGFDKDKFNNAVLTVNENIKELCEKYGIEYVDYHSKMCDKDGKTMRAGLTYDGVHPTPAGYEIMTKVLKEKF